MQTANNAAILVICRASIPLDASPASKHPAQQAAARLSEPAMPILQEESGQGKFKQLRVRANWRHHTEGLSANPDQSRQGMQSALRITVVVHLMRRRSWLLSPGQRCESTLQMRTEVLNLRRALG